MTATWDTAWLFGAILSRKRAAMPARLRACSLEHSTKEWAVLSREVICLPDSVERDSIEKRTENAARGDRLRLEAEATENHCRVPACEI